MRRNFSSKKLTRELIHPSNMVSVGDGWPEEGHRLLQKCFNDSRTNDQGNYKKFRQPLDNLS